MRFAIGTMRYLVVSSNTYDTAFGDRRVIAVEVDSRAIYRGGYREPIVGRRTLLAAPVSTRRVEAVCDLLGCRIQRDPAATAISANGAVVLADPRTPFPPGDAAVTPQ